MSSIRMQKTSKIQHILDMLRRTKFPLFDDVEILKALLANSYLELDPWNLNARFATEEEEESIRKSEKDIQAGRVTIIEPGEEIDPNMF